MARIFLVRHGQASFGEKNYDKLTIQGHKQAFWLGEYFRHRNIQFSKILCGTLSRQKCTAAGIILGLDSKKSMVQINSGLDEYDNEVLYMDYTKGCKAQQDQITAPSEYWRTFRKAYEGWIADQYETSHESWDSFCLRINSSLDNALENTNKNDNILIITSAGVIGVIISELLKAPAQSAIELNFQVRNTSFTEIIAKAQTKRLISFNNIPHLDQPNRRSFISYI